MFIFINAQDKNILLVNLLLNLLTVPYFLNRGVPEHINNCIDVFPKKTILQEFESFGVENFSSHASLHWDNHEGETGFTVKLKQAGENICFSRDKL